MEGQMVQVPDDFYNQFVELRKDVKESSRATMEISYSLKNFMHTEDLERKLMKKDIEANRLAIEEIKSDKQFARRTVISEIIKYVVLAVALLIVATKL